MCPIIMYINMYVLESTEFDISPLHSKDIENNILMLGKMKYISYLFRWKSVC